MQRLQKITLGECGSPALPDLLVYCGDYQCAHSIFVGAARWGDDVRLSDLEPRFTCKGARRGADIGPLPEPEAWALGEKTAVSPAIKMAQRAQCWAMKLLLRRQIGILSGASYGVGKCGNVYPSLNIAD